jgi:transposase
MPRYNSINTNPQFLAIDLAQQLLPGTFEHALNHLLDHAIDLSHFDGRIKNDLTGATAYPPALLLKVVLFAYSRGIVSSRAIARACEEHVTFIALRGTRTPHFTTIAHFVSTLGDDIARVFAAVLAVCDHQGLIGRHRRREIAEQRVQTSERHAYGFRPAGRQAGSGGGRDAPAASRSRSTPGGAHP